MAKLQRFDLTHNQKNDNWVLKNSAGKTVDSFETKKEATTGGVLKDSIGAAGGSVRIHKENGRIQEERTYPRSADPRSSRG